MRQEAGLIAIFLLIGAAFLLVLPFAIKEMIAYIRLARRFEAELAKRHFLDDRAFCQTFYADSDVDMEIPIRLRKLYARELGQVWMNLQPQDNAEEIYPELDFAELVIDAAAEFEVKVPLDEMRLLDGSFDSLVRCLDGKLKKRGR